MPFGWLKKSDSDDWIGFLEKGVRIEGNLEAPGTLRLDSELKGKIISGDTLVLGENSNIQGEIHGNLVIVGGRFEGTIQAKSKVEIQDKAIATGEIFTPCLVIESGGVFDGQCHMIPASETAKAITIPIRSGAAAG